VWPTIAVRGEITATLGRAGKGKTTMNLNRIFAWAAGRELFPGWTDHDGNTYLSPEKPLRTMIAENEGNASMFHQKVGLLVKEGDLNPEQQELCLDNIFVHGDGGYSGMKLDNDVGRGAVILSHHMRKGNDDGDDKMSMARGSTVLEGVVAVMENFESVKDGEYREMTWSKARYLPPPTPVRMEWDRDTGWYKWVPTSAIADGVIALLREADDEPLNLSAIAEETGETKAKLRPIVKKLEEEKRVKKMPSISTQDGSTGARYRLPTGDGDTGDGALAI
jgi:hypothetical protein